MGVALNGKDDLRMLRGAVIIGFAGVALLFTVGIPRRTPVVNGAGAMASYG